MRRALITVFCLIAEGLMLTGNADGLKLLFGDMALFSFVMWALCSALSGRQKVRALGLGLLPVSIALLIPGACGKISLIVDQLYVIMGVAGTVISGVGCFLICLICIFMTGKPQGISPGSYPGYPYQYMGNVPEPPKNVFGRLSEAIDALRGVRRDTPMMYPVMMAPPVTQTAPEPQETKPTNPLESTLYEMGIKGKVAEKITGRRLTRYIVRTPLGGNDRSRLLRSADTLEEAFMTPGISVTKAPAHGGIAIDIPGGTEKPLYLSELSGDGILIGETVEGEALGINLWKLPHLLIAGTTGSGKSVCLKTIVNQLECPCLVIDPKGTEFTQGISSAGEALAEIKALEAEMESRYQQMKENGLTDWDGERICCVIDELENILSQNAAIADPLIRLAQKARAAGIHLVVATQRPARKEIPSQLLANIPGRIAFRVSDPVDSRTILSHGGAEDLLGNGDGYLLRNGSLIRFQGALSGQPDPIIWEPEYVSEDAEGLSERAKQALDYMTKDGWTECSGASLEKALGWRHGTGGSVVEELENAGYVGEMKKNRKRDVIV